MLKKNSGEFTTSVNTIVNGKREYPVINPKKKDKKGYQDSGVFVFGPNTKIWDREQLVKKSAFS